MTNFAITSTNARRSNVYDTDFAQLLLDMGVASTRGRLGWISAYG